MSPQAQCRLLDSRRRRFLLGAGAAGLALAFGCGLPFSQPPQTAKMPRVGWLANTTLDAVKANSEAFRQGMRELGYVEDRDFVLEIRAAEGRQERVPELAAELVRLPVDVVITTGTVPTSAAQAASSTIPIVMVGTEDPVGSGFAGSLARPGGNITGLSTMAVQLNGKRLELLKQIVPGASRVAVLWNPAIPERASEFPETEIAARALGLEVVSLEVREASGLEAAFDAAVGERSTALLTLDNLVTTNNRSRVVGLATKSRVPMMSQRQEMAYAGGLLAYAPDTVDQRRRAAIFVDKILKGARPGDLPIEQPTKIDFIVNLKTAEALGISIPQSVLAQATEVIR